MSIDYRTLIRESDEDLLKLEKEHRFTPLNHSVRILRLLKSDDCYSLVPAVLAAFLWAESRDMVPKRVTDLQRGGTRRCGS